MANYEVGGIAAAIDANGNIWLSDMYNYGLDGLYRYNFKKKAFELVHIFSRDGNYKAGLHGLMEIVDNNVLMFPVYDDKICIYNINEEKEKLIPVKSNDSYYTNCRIKDYVWMVSSTCKNVYKYSFVTGELSEDEQLMNVFNELEIKNINCLFTIEPDNLQIAFYWAEKKSIVNIILKDYSYNIISLDTIKEDIYTVRYHAFRYWVLLKNSTNVYSYDIRNKELSKYCSIGTELIRYGMIPYGNVYSYNGRVIILNLYAKKAMIALENKKILEPILPKYNTVTSNKLVTGGFYETILVFNSKLYFIPAMGTHILEFDKNLKLLNTYHSKASIDDNMAVDVLYELWKQKSVLVEDGELSCLESFIELLDRR